jgi:hypothetical protein
MNHKYNNKFDVKHHLKFKKKKILNSARNISEATRNQSMQPYGSKALSVQRDIWHGDLGFHHMLKEDPTEFLMAT